MYSKNSTQQRKATHNPHALAMQERSYHFRFHVNHFGASQKETKNALDDARTATPWPHFGCILPKMHVSEMGAISHARKRESTSRVGIAGGTRDRGTRSVRPFEINKATLGLKVLPSRRTACRSFAAHTHTQSPCHSSTEDQEKFDSISAHFGASPASLPAHTHAKLQPKYCMPAESCRSSAAYYGMCLLQ